MKIKLIALDLDETTLHSDGTLSADTRRLLALLPQKGCHVMLASGRSFHTMP